MISLLKNSSVPLQLVFPSCSMALWVWGGILIGYKIVQCLLVICSYGQSDLDEVLCKTQIWIKLFVLYILSCIVWGRGVIFGRSSQPIFNRHELGLASQAWPGLAFIPYFQPCPSIVWANYLPEESIIWMVNPGKKLIKLTVRRAEF